jgi:hypothetical protein
MASSDQLQEVIKSATDERLRVTLLAMCSKSEEASKLASEELLVQSSATKKRKSDDEHSNIRYDMCTQCDKEFDTTTNGPESCQWHDGEVSQTHLAYQFPDFDKACWRSILTAISGLITTRSAMGQLIRIRCAKSFLMGSCGTAATNMELVGKSLSLLMDRSKKTTKAATRDHIWDRWKLRVRNSCSFFLSTSDSNACKG